MTYREEVEQAILEAFRQGMPAHEHGVVAARALIMLGVKLGLEWAAATADEFSEVPHVAAQIRDIHPGYVLQVKP